ncbi:ABC transporter substrate-binding protein (plasmid) [Haladaptatus sp. SPP-AMP-3]|uniref:ABC transporter substrate-binding protein n=1 Tax=Haladaptatus sp. SPP-AMP-3 TaxID=3121295 RepID=UPI003C2CCC10
MTKHEENGLTRRKLLASLGIAGAGALSGCSAIERVSGGSGSQLRIAQPLTATTLDPVVIESVPSAQVATQVFEGLYTYGEGTTLEPELADGEPKVSRGGTRYEVSLKSEPRFQNGNSVTAEDVKYSFEAPSHRDENTPWRRGTPNKWEVDMIDTIETPDDHTVRFELSYPYDAFHEVLTRAVVPKSVRDPDPETFAKNPVGSGPFQVDRFVPQKYAVLTRWDDYWDSPKAAIDRLKFVSEYSGLSRTMSLKTGQNQLVEEVEPHLWKATNDQPNATVKSSESYDYTFLGFNCNGGPTSEEKVRKAVDYCVNFDGMVENILRPAGERTYSPLPHQLAEEWDMPVDEWKRIPNERNIEKAQTLFRDAGVEAWAPKIAVPASKSSGDELLMMMANAVKQGLTLAGFQQASVEKYSWSVFHDKIVSGSPSDYHMFVTEWSAFPDPDAYVYPLFHQRAEGETNGVFYKNDDVMEKILEARKSDEHAKRRRLYEETITTLLEDRVHLPIYQPKNAFGVKKELDDFELSPMSEENPRFVGSEYRVTVGE